MSLHLSGIVGLVLIFVIATWRPVNLGALALVMTFLVGTFAAGETPREMLSGFPIDLFLLLVGVTSLFAVAVNNGTVERIVEGTIRLVKGRRALIPWIVFTAAALPAMAGALGSAGVAILAPIALRLATRYGIDRRLIGLMVVHGAAAGNFSPLNVLGVLVSDAIRRAGLEFSATALFVSNLAYNLALGVILVAVFGGLRRGKTKEAAPDLLPDARSWTIDQVSTIVALAGVCIGALGFGLNIGFLALAAAVLLQLAFPASAAGLDKRIAWGVVLLVCGIVTYVAALQRYGTVGFVGDAAAGLGSPLLTALVICAIGAVTSAFASSAGILGAMIPLAVPFMAQGAVSTTGMVIALALSATVVDATPFSTVGALVVANADEGERAFVYRGLLTWGAIMVLTAPIVTWAIFLVILRLY